MGEVAAAQPRTEPVPTPRRTGNWAGQASRAHAQVLGMCLCTDSNAFKAYNPVHARFEDEDEVETDETEDSDDDA